MSGTISNGSVQAQNDFFLKNGFTYSCSDNRTKETDLTIFG